MRGGGSVSAEAARGCEDRPAWAGSAGASGSARSWTYLGYGPVGFAFRAEAACSATGLLADVGCSKASRGKMFAHGQVLRGMGCAAAPNRDDSLQSDVPCALGPLVAGARLAAGDVVVIAPLVTREAGPASDAPIDVLYEDEFVLAVDKPAGILVHGDGSDAETLTARVQGYLQRAGSLAVPQALQRLDIETSGVVLFSKVEEFQPLFDALVAGEAGEGPTGPRALFADKPLRKTYLAIVDGAVPWETRACDAPIGRDRHDARRMRVSPTGQPSLTWARRLAVAPDGRHTLLQVELGTGRRHQIRVHLAHLGFPITGDPLYGVSANGVRRGALAASRARRQPGASLGSDLASWESSDLMLHATFEEFIHPLTGAPIRIEAPYPARFACFFPKKPRLR